MISPQDYSPRYSRSLLLGAGVCMALSLAACSEPPQEAPAPEPPPAEEPVAATDADASARQALFGAVHVHTQYSFDAFTNGTVTNPQHAYDWARGKPIPGNADGMQFQIKTPLDFYAVSDHAEMMGVFPRMADPDDPLSEHPMAERVMSDDPVVAMEAFAEILLDMSNGRLDPAFTDPDISRSVWSEIVATADANYEPGEFTTFPAFEWTSNPAQRNLHRVVIFEDSSLVPELAYSGLDSEDPEDLWNWMNGQRDAGSTLLAIPHNANASDGLMFAAERRDGTPLDAEYVAERMRNEPVYEISQIKGTSETHPDLSPNDEFAGFELWDYTLSAESERPTRRQGSYARQALLDGLSFDVQGIGNPFQYGFIGDTDTHNAAASNEEYNYTGKFAMESEPRHRLLGMEGQRPAQVQQIREFSSGGLAGVWAEENTRESIYAAIARRETFATSGPHIRVRLFAGFDLQSDADGDWVAEGYAQGVPMGGSLSAADRGDAEAPTFAAWAIKDPNSGNLDRLQLVKGWVDADGEQQEQVYDLAWSDGRELDGEGKLPAVGNTVDLATATYTNDIGDAEFFASWTDPDFDPAEHAFYYLRVLEIPTPRWSTRDAVALGVDIPEGLPATIQERAWSSPVWYRPE